MSNLQTDEKLLKRWVFVMVALIPEGLSSDIRCLQSQIFCKKTTRDWTRNQPEHESSQKFHNMSIPTIP